MSKAFASKQVVASRKQEDGSEGTCISAQLDFIASPTDDPGLQSFVWHSVPLIHAIHPANLPLFQRQFKGRVETGNLCSGIEKAYSTNSDFFEKLSGFSTPLGPPMREHVMSINTGDKLIQDHLPLPSKPPWAVTALNIR